MSEQAAEFRKRLSRSWRPALVVALVAWALRSPTTSYAAQNLDAALVESLARHGLVSEAVNWLEPGPISHDETRWGWRKPARALFRARTGDADRSTESAHDVYLARVALSPEGRLLNLDGVYNLTRTNVADESEPAVSGQRAAWTIAGQTHAFTLKLLDLAGAPPNPTWPTLDRIKQAVTNLQHTGQLRGVRLRSFRFEPAAKQVALSFDGDALQVTADGHRIQISDTDIEGQRYIKEQTQPTARPGNLVTWAVDRVRQSQSFGDERMQWVKAVSYRVLDRVRRWVGAAMPAPRAADVYDELGATLSAPLASFPDPETGWPPPPIEPVLDPPLEGEGQWRALDADPFIRNNPGLPPSFVTTFIRTDEERKFSRLFVVLWDPRQVELHMMSGTEEPVSATGETGTGLVPRDPKLIERLLAGFNGGFQGTHGGFGMAVGETLFVPPKPYAATVARLDDGSTAFGTWPAVANERPTLEVTERRQIPKGIHSFRQNLTPLIADSKFNPYGRIWWGGVPREWEDDTRTVRSGLCKTRDGFIVYFYGATVDHKHLAKAMQAARCDYALHLDMNQGHTGLEFYQVGTESELPLLEEKLHGMWQAQGPVSGMPGYRFRGRRLFKTMQLMNFPRFIRQERRDFFYLTLRHLLPGPKLAPEGATLVSDEGEWRTKGLPQYGFPHAIATTVLRPDATRPDTKVRVLKLDSKFLSHEPATSNADQEHLVLSVDATPDGSEAVGHAAIVWDEGVGWAAKHDDATRGRPLFHGSASPTENTVAAAGVGANDGMLYFAEVTTAQDPSADGRLLARLLQSAGCQQVVFQSRASRIAIAGSRDLSGHPVRRSASAVPLYRVAGPGIRELFEQTPIVPREEWYWPQKGKPRPW